MPQTDRSHMPPSEPRQRPGALIPALITMLLLGACGDEDTAIVAPPPAAPPPEACAEGSRDDGMGACIAFAERTVLRAPTPFMDAGARPVTLEVVLFRPVGSDEQRLPTAVIHHGSTGDGSDPAQFALTFTSPAVTEYFVSRGWMVAYPQRRGRGQSDGLYDEGFLADRSAYSCEAETTLAGAERALEDLDAIVDWLRMRADVDTTRLVVSGSSRGGILAVAHVARRPDLYLGAINFVGGWLGEGCGDYRRVNEDLFVDGAAYPGETLWIYAERDSFYSLTHSRGNFDAFSAAGGLGTFAVLERAPGLNGHFVINDLDRWSPVVTDYLARAGLD